MILVKVVLFRAEIELKQLMRRKLQPDCPVKKKRLNLCKLYWQFEWASYDLNSLSKDQVCALFMWEKLHEAENIKLDTSECYKVNLPLTKLISDQVDLTFDWRMAHNENSLETMSLGQTLHAQEFLVSLIPEHKSFNLETNKYPHSHNNLFNYCTHSCFFYDFYMEKCHFKDQFCQKIFFTFIAPTDSKLSSLALSNILKVHLYATRYYKPPYMQTK